MAKKRMTDVEIWDQEWFMDLTPKLKCLIRYLFDNCDASGVWKPNWKLASLRIGESVDNTDLEQLPKEQWEWLDGKVFLPGFINFQYGKLSEKSPAHIPVFKAIEKNNLSDRVFNRVVHRVSNTLQEKEEEKEIEKEAVSEDRGLGEETKTDARNTGLVHELKADFKKVFPLYADEDADAPALLQISYKIGKTIGLTKYDVLNGSGYLVRNRWGEMVEVIQTDPWYSSKSIHFLNNKFTEFNQFYNSRKNGTHQQSNRSDGSGAAKLGRSAINDAARAAYGGAISGAGAGG